MVTPRSGSFLGLTLALSAMAGDVAPAAQAARISKPKPVPPSEMAPLPPAVIDNSLAIGGENIDASQIRTRMTVEVKVNGRGPYKFLVDSGADSSVVGLRIAQDLNLPLASPAILHGMTDSARVDRVHVAQLSLGNSTIHDLELPALREQDLGGQGMLGIDALVQQRLLMDFEDLSIKVEDARQRIGGRLDFHVATVRIGQVVIDHILRLAAGSHLSIEQQDAALAQRLHGSHVV